jgi:hypothetical protein
MERIPKMITETFTPEELAAARHCHDVALGVAFDWWLVSAAGAGFALFREPHHTDADIFAAKAHLMRDRDVVGRIHVRYPK